MPVIPFALSCAVTLEFRPTIKKTLAANGEFAFRRSPLVYVLEITAEIVDFQGRELRCAEMNRASGMHDLIRRDLAEAGLLARRFLDRPDRLGTIRSMGNGRAAEEFVSEHLTEYEDAWCQSLTLNTPNPEMAQVRVDSGVTTLTVQLAAPEVMVLVVR